MVGLIFSGGDGDGVMVMLMLMLMLMVMVIMIMIMMVMVEYVVRGWRLLCPLDTGTAPDKLPLDPPRHRPLLNGPPPPYRTHLLLTLLKSLLF